MLEVIGLDKTYGSDDTQVHALRGVDFAVEKGEFVLVVGSSGSGKSTLLNMIGLLDRPTAGKVVIDGTDTAELGDGEISTFRNRKLGFIFQFSNLLTDLTVYENIMLPKQILGSSVPKGERVEDLIRAVGLSDQSHRRANRISGGQAQRAAIARGLVNDPAVVLADEPTGNLDSVTAGTIVDLMKSMAKKMGLTFIIVTHDRHQFGDVDRVITIKDGRAFDEARVPA
ncbi:ABC-type transport system, involved in lipoprotein release, ATPase component [Cenarchaeum symbiosum A]|uniref:ABC-type transport system, involved in lipoprotein release, ATPase component n=1 Tax=Cenarchaeum symbiosum (strain A) TaxID=414004 RepID=A0RXR1_CENSY|nr:ABC-type transport system, involved in lipoprotein release, ATPase component [Cenarchaeum symbiosum A]